MSTKRKLPTKIVQPVVKQSAKKPLKTHINEADTAVSAPTISKTENGPDDEMIEISSDPASSEYGQSEEEDEEESFWRLTQDHGDLFDQLGQEAEKEAEAEEGPPAEDHGASSDSDYYWNE